MINIRVKNSIQANVKRRDCDTIGYDIYHTVGEARLQ